MQKLFLKKRPHQLQAKNFTKYIGVSRVISLIRNRDFYGIGIVMVLAVLIGYQEMISPAIGILILIVITEGIFLKTLKFRFNGALILFVGLYIIYLAGLMWSDNSEIGWKLMEYKMSFFIFPVLFLFPKKSIDYRFYLQGIVWGCVLLAARFLFETYLLKTDLSFYEIARQRLNLHPTYVAIYFSSAVVFLCWNFLKETWKIHKLVAVFLGLVFSYFIILTGSFAGILFLGILIAIGAGYLIYRFVNRLALLVYLVLVPFGIYFTLSQINSLAYDLEVISQLRNEIGDGKVAFLEKNKTQISGSRERVMLWYISAEIIAENPLGVGTGDIDFHLQEKCEKYDLQLLKQQNLNPHNQFLQIGIDIGWLGIVYLLSMLLIYIWKGLHDKNWFLILIVLSLFFNALFESVLQRQSGIVFYTLIICLLLISEVRSKSDQSQNQ